MAASTLETEANAVTDNPLVLADGSVVSGGNFHAEPVAFAADQIAIAVCEIGAIAQRRIALLVDPALSFGLPAFLAKKPGLNSGLMIAEVTSAALMSENKQMSHPASVDSSTDFGEPGRPRLDGLPRRPAAAPDDRKPLAESAGSRRPRPLKDLHFRAPLKTGTELHKAYTGGTLGGSWNWTSTDIWPTTSKAGAELVLSGALNASVSAGILPGAGELSHGNG